MLHLKDSFSLMDKSNGAGLPAASLQVLQNQFGFSNHQLQSLVHQHQQAFAFHQQVCDDKELMSKEQD